VTDPYNAVLTRFMELYLKGVPAHAASEMAEREIREKMAKDGGCCSGHPLPEEGQDDA